MSSLEASPNPTPQLPTTVPFPKSQNGAAIIWIFKWIINLQKILYCLLHISSGSPISLRKDAANYSLWNIKLAFHFNFIPFLSLNFLYSYFSSIIRKKIQCTTSAQSKPDITSCVCCPGYYKKCLSFLSPQPSLQGPFPSAAHEPAVLSSRLHTGIPGLSHSYRTDTAYWSQSRTDSASVFLPSTKNI